MSAFNRNSPLISNTSSETSLLQAPLSEEKGASMLEFAIILPVIVILFFGVVEGGFALNTYLNLTQVAREGVRLGGKTLGLEPGAQYSTSVSNGTPTYCGGKHQAIHAVMVKFLNHHHLYQWFKTGPVITTERTSSGNGNTISVTIKGTYNGWLLLKGIELNVKDTGPYLHR